MSNQNLSELLNQLLADGYVTVEKNKYVFTRKFYEQVDPSQNMLPVLVNPGLAVMPQTVQDWENLFISFIKEAKVPPRLEDNRGGVYYANKYSAEGMKVFKRALESGVNYQVLVKSVFLYYQSSVRFKKAVGNYFRDGDWKTDYEALMVSAEQGADAIKQHIQNETRNEQSSQYKLG